MSDPKIDSRRTGKNRKRSLGQELSADLMRRSDFLDDDDGIDVHRKHTTTDRPCLSSVGFGPFSPVSERSSARSTLDEQRTCEAGALTRRRPSPGSSVWGYPSFH